MYINTFTYIKYIHIHMHMYVYITLYNQENDMGVTVPEKIEISPYNTDLISIGNMEISIVHGSSGTIAARGI